MDTSRSKICPFCGKMIPAIASSCRLCGGEFVLPAEAVPTYVAVASSGDKKKARRLFWLGLVFAFIGCFHSASSDPEFAGNALDASVYALWAGALNYLAGVFPAVMNSFNPLFLGPSGGVASRALVFVGAATLVWSCRYLVSAKGYRGIWGYLGILGIAGLVVLMLIPDKHKLRPALRQRRSY